VTVSEWDRFVIGAGLVLKVVGVCVIFGVGVYVGWQARGAIGAIPFSQAKPAGAMPPVKAPASPSTLSNGGVFQPDTALAVR